MEKTIQNMSRHDATVEAVNPFGALPRLLSLCALGTQRGKEVNNDARLKPTHTHFTPLIIGCSDTVVSSMQNPPQAQVQFQDGDEAKH